MRPVNKQKKDKGFTLIEMLVAIAIFGLLAGAFTGFMLSALQAQRRILVTQELLNNASYVLEYMSRSIRMAKKDINGQCITAGQNYSSDGSSLKFLNYQQDECQEFFLEGGILKEKKTRFNDHSESIINDLTPANLQVTNFEVTVTGDETGYQPKVTLKLTIEGRGEKSELKPQITLQTSVSQRDLNYVE